MSSPREFRARTLLDGRSCRALTLWEVWEVVRLPDKTHNVFISSW